jgi:hypothetical protein
MIEVLVGAVAALGSLTAAPPPEDPEAAAELAFSSEASATYGPLTFVACYVDPSGAPIGCYGMTSTPSLLVGIAQPGEPFAFTEYTTIASGEPPDTGGAEAAGTAAPTFGDGTWVVGQDIEPGTYRSDVPAGDFCYWERLSGFGGDILEDVITNDAVEGPQQVIVEIAPTDAGFTSDDCGTWTKVS